MYRSASDRISSENSDLEPDEYKLAFESIRCTPVSAFSRGHKCLLFNQILLSLCRLPWDNQELQSVIDHLNLLSDLLAFPQKSMNISAILTGMPKEDFQQDHGSVLVAIAANIDYNMTRLTQSYKGGKIHEVNEALRRLALLVHRYELRNKNHIGS